MICDSNFPVLIGVIWRPKRKKRDASGLIRAAVQTVRLLAGSGLGPRFVFVGGIVWIGSGLPGKRARISANRLRAWNAASNLKVRGRFHDSPAVATVQGSPIHQQSA